jgi:L-asparaginase
VPDTQRRVAVLALGGTIAMTPAAAGGAAPSLSGQDLITNVPGLPETGIALDVIDFRRVPGASVSFGDLIQLCELISAKLADGVDGIVITQGTDTIEETAFLLDLYYTADQPVVITGAMRNPSLAGADGPANLLAAIVTAADPAARGLGVLVVFADEIHAARRVRKTHSTSIGTFQSPNAGPLGYVVEDVPHLHSRLAHRFHIPPPTGAMPPVGIITIAFSDQGELLDGVESKVDALVIAAMGGGHVPENLVAPLEKLAKAMPVVLASRTGSGATLRKTYGFAGSESDLESRRLLLAGFLHPLKARLLLAAALAAGADRHRVAAAIAVAGGYSHPGHWPWPIRHEGA